MGIASSVFLVTTEQTKEQKIQRKINKGMTIVDDDDRTGENYDDHDYNDERW